ncbi:MAG: hypothetical protein ACHRHE_16925 [Tepidisphaerales bacterium]
MFFCRRCGANQDRQDGSAFCGNCGEPRRAAAVARPMARPAPALVRAVANRPPQKSRSPLLVALPVIAALVMVMKFFVAVSRDSSPERSPAVISTPVRERIVVERPVYIQQPMAPTAPNLPSFPQQLYPGRRGNAAPGWGTMGANDARLPNAGVPGINRNAYQMPMRSAPGVTVPGVNHPHVPGSPMTIDQFGRPVYPAGPGTHVDPYRPVP